MLSLTYRATKTKTKQLAKKIATYFPNNKRFIVFLKGELGSGKTSFSGFLLKALGYNDIVKSPTYTLIEAYQVANYHFLHLDLYRLQAPTEILEIGLEDELNQASIWLIEWPERALSFLPTPDLVCTFTIIRSWRKIVIQASTPLGQQLLANLQKNNK